MSLASEFKEFINRGNVVDLAVGVIIGGAFGKIVSSLVDGVIMPPLGMLTGGINFSDAHIVLKPGTDGASTFPNIVAAKAAGAVTLNYGLFIQEVINFLIIAFVIFLMVKGINKMRKPVESAPAGPSEVDLLVEIRDLMKKG